MRKVKKKIDTSMKYKCIGTVYNNCFLSMSISEKRKWCAKIVVVVGVNMIVLVVLSVVDDLPLQLFSE